MWGWGKERNNISSLCDWKILLLLIDTGLRGEGTWSRRLGRKVDRNYQTGFRDIEREMVPSLWPWPMSSSHISLLCVIIWHVCISALQLYQKDPKDSCLTVFVPPQDLAQSFTPLVPALWEVNLDCFSRGISAKICPREKGTSLGSLTT